MFHEYRRAEKAKEFFNQGCELEKLEKYEEAIKCYDKSLEIEPNNPDAWRNKGNIAYKKDDYSKAIDCFNKVIELSPNNHQDVKEKIRKSNEAMKAFEKSLYK